MDFRRNPLRPRRRRSSNAAHVDSAGRTQIAVYPIDVCGVAYFGADAATLSWENYARYGSSYDESSGQDPELFSIHQTMSTQASMTGGRAVFGRNDLDGAIRATVDAGANFYTLAYRPQNTPDVKFVAAAWDTAGPRKGNVPASFHLPLNAAQFEVLAQTGLQIHQDMDLKPGTYQLRLGVLDRLSGKMGTLDVPLSIESP